MAVSLNRGGSGRGRSAYRPMAEINVTPMVDVMLVLLIVFMVAAPLLTVGVPVDLPKSQAAALSDDKPPLVITIDAQDQIYLGGGGGQDNTTDQKSAIDEESLVPKLQAITGENPDAVIYIRADQSISYGKVLELMGRISGAGFTKVSLVSDPSQDK